MKIAALPLPLALFRVITAGAAAGVSLTGLVVLAGWILDVPPLKSVLPGLATMKVNTASAFLLAGLSLWLRRTERPRQWRSHLGTILAAAVALIGMLTLVEYAVGLDLGIDQILCRDAPDSVGTSSPGRMSQITAVCFLLLGLALLLLDRSARWRLRPSEILAACAAFLALLALVGYVYGVSSLYKVGPYASVALHTAVAFFALSLGVLTARTDRGMAALALADTAGGHMARRLLPTLVVFLFVLGWLRLAGQDEGLYDRRFGTALMVLVEIAACTALVYWNARSLHRIDLARRGADQDRSFLAAIVESSEDAIVGENLDGVIISWNAGAERLFGYTAEEVRGRPLAILAAPETPDEMPDILGRVSRGERVTHHETVRDSEGRLAGGGVVERVARPGRRRADRRGLENRPRHFVPQKGRRGAGGGPGRGRAGPGPAARRGLQPDRRADDHRRARRRGGLQPGRDEAVWLRQPGGGPAPPLGVPQSLRHVAAGRTAAALLGVADLKGAAGGNGRGRGTPRPPPRRREGPNHPVQRGARARTGRRR